MRIDSAVIRHSHSEMHPHLASVIDTMKNANGIENLVAEMNKVKEWHTLFGKTEMSRWAEVLDRVDEMFETGCEVKDFQLVVDTDPTVKAHVLSGLRFSAMIFENTSSRSLYASTDRLIVLLDSYDLEVVAEVLRFLQVISKRSRFLSSKLPRDVQKKLVEKLIAIAECWGGKLRHVKLEQCVRADFEVPELFPFVFTNAGGQPVSLSKEEVSRPLLAVVDDLSRRSDLADADSSTLIARLRLLRGFHLHSHRMQSLVIRLLATSTLLYSRCHPEETVSLSLTTPTFIEETCSVLKLDSSLDPMIDSIKAEALRTLTSIISADKPPSSYRLSNIMENLGATSYHGFLASFTRECVDALKEGKIGTDGYPSVALCTALFSLLYHMSSVDPGGRRLIVGLPSTEALVSSGLTQTLLSVIEAHSIPLDLISFATRCVRVIDIISTLDVNGFTHHKGMEVCVNRLVHEVEECRKEQPFVIDVAGDVEGAVPAVRVARPVEKVFCHHQRAALIKSLLNFIKRVIQDNQFTEMIRHIMDGPLPDALMHIVSNADYYSASLFHQAIQVFTHFIYQEPAQLTHLQQKHVPYVILQALLRKEIPSSREVITNLANTLTALCLNERGLTQLKLYNPFDDIFKILLSTKFLFAMKRKKNDFSDSAGGIGSSFDDLLRHQPSLKPLMFNAISNTLARLISLGNDPSPPGTKITFSLVKSSVARSPSGSALNSPFAPLFGANEYPPSPSYGAGEDSDEEEEDPEASRDTTNQQDTNLGLEMEVESSDGGKTLPLGEYLTIFVRIIEVLLTQNGTADMVELFLERHGVERLLDLTRVVNIRNDLPNNSQLLTHIAGILKHILVNWNKDEVLNHMMDWCDTGFSPLNEILEEPKVPANGASLFAHLPPAKLTEMFTNITTTTTMLAGLTRISTLTQMRESDLRSKTIMMWTDDASSGLRLHRKLHRVYNVLAWEAGVINVTRSSVKVSSQTQTEADPADIDSTTEERTTETTISTGVDRESVAPRAGGWENARVSEEETAFWSKHRDIAKQHSRAFKSVSELLVLMARLCIGTGGRSRRGYEQNTYILAKPALKLVTHVFSEYLTDTTRIPAGYDNKRALVCSYLTDVLSQLNCIIFDDRRHAYHHLLSRFYHSGCYQKVMDLFSEIIVPCIQARNIDFAVESLLTEWLKLIRKCAGKVNVIQSKHRIGETQAHDFPIKKFFALVQQDTFDALGSLLPIINVESIDKSPFLENQKLSEMFFTLLKDTMHNMMEMREEKEDTPPVDAAPRYDGADIARLMDMGFDQNASIQALTNFPTVTEATEFLLSSNERRPPELDLRRMLNVDMEDVLASLDPDTDRLRDVEAGTLRVRTVRQGTDQPGTSTQGSTAEPVPLPEVEKLSTRTVKLEWERIVDKTCSEWIPLLLRFIDAPSGDHIFNAADITTCVVRYAKEEWRRKTLLDGYMRSDIETRINKMKMLTNEASARHLGALLHYSCIVFEHVSKEYLEVLAANPLTTALFELLAKVNYNIELDYLATSLLSQILLWFDLFEKCTRYVRRKALYDKVESLDWQYFGFEERYASRGKWMAYPEDACKQLTAALLSGKTTCTVKMARREYTVNFVEMSHRGENSMDRCNVIALLNEQQTKEIDIQKVVNEELRDVWDANDAQKLMALVTSLLTKWRIVGHGAHSALSLIARLTRRRSAAQQFVNQGGVSALLQLRSQSVPHSTVLFSIVMRHCLDDESILSQQFEKILRGIANNTSNTGHRYSLVRNTGGRNWLSGIALYSPLATRSAKQYIEVAERVSKMDKTGLLVVTPPTQSTGGTTTPSHTQAIVEMLLEEVLTGDWSTENNGRCGSTNFRMFPRATILSVMAELVKAYPAVGQLVTEMKTASGGTAIAALLSTYSDPTIDKDTTSAMRACLAALAACNHSPKAQEAVVMDIRTVLISFLTTSEPIDNIHLKVSEMALLLMDMMQTCPLVHPTGHPPATHHRQIPTYQNNAIVRLIVKKRICNELMRCVTRLVLSKRECIETANTVIRSIDELSRVINHAPHVPREGDHPRVEITQQQTASNDNNSANQQPPREEAPRPLANQVVNEDVPPLVGESSDEESDSGSRHDEDEGEDDMEGDDVDDEEQDDEGDDEEEEEEMEDTFDESIREQGRIERTADETDQREEGSMSSGGEEQGVEEHNGEADQREEADSEMEEDDYAFETEENQYHDDVGMDIIHRLFVEMADDSRGAPRLAELMDHPFILDSPDFTHRIVYRGGTADLSFNLGALANPIDAPRAPTNAHPLMQRPASTWNDNTNNVPVRTVGPLQSRSFLLFGTRRGPQTLHRQNAVRRHIQNIPPEVFSRFLDPPYRANRSVLQLIDNGGSSSLFYDEPMESRVGTSIPSAIDRLGEASRMLDEQHVTLLAIVLNSYLYYKAVEAQKKDEAEAEAQKAVEEKKEDGDKTPTGEATPTHHMDTSTVTPTAEILRLIGNDLDAAAAQLQLPPTDAVQPVLGVVVPPPRRGAPTTTAPPTQQSSSEGETAPVLSAHNAQDNVDVTMDETAPTLEAPTQEDVRMTTPEDQPGTGSWRSDVTATEYEPSRGEDSRDADVAGVSTPRAEENEQTPANTEAAPPDHEYRHILGDMVIPEGVDPAFLAALPEDMRAEVLRDHERQQRAQRIAETRPPPSAAVEPLDQEFLAALPPELQEEILAQHERALRSAQAEAAAAAPEQEQNPAEVIQSLPPSLRTQVLSDADDSVLQVLPPELAAEARRLREERGHHLQGRIPHLRRELHEQMYQRFASARNRGATRQGGSNIGNLAGATNIAPANGMQVLDKEALSSLLILFFLDQRLHLNKLHKTIRSLCMHRASCDFVIYALLSILEKSCETDDEEVVSCSPSWIDSITVPGIGHNERVLKIDKNGKVSVHPLVGPNVSKNVLDILCTIAKTFPGHFLPQVLRKNGTKSETVIPPPSLSAFWQCIHSFSHKPSSPKDALHEVHMDTLEDSPLAILIKFFRRPSVTSNAQLHDRLMKLLSYIMQTLPDNTLSLLGHDVPSGEYPLDGQLRLVINVLTQGTCTQDALSDGRTLLVEAMRAMNFETTGQVYKILFEQVEKLGLELKPQIESLAKELSSISISDVDVDRKRSVDERNRPGTSREEEDGGREIEWHEAIDSIRGEQRGRAVASCAELQVPSVRALTEKHGVQNALLSALQTICKVRDTLRAMVTERKKKRMEEATRAYENARKELEEKWKKEDEERAKREEETKQKEDPPERQELKVEDFVVEDTTSVPEIRLSERLEALDGLWDVVSRCLIRLGKASDPHAVLALQPAAEAFFLVHAVPQKEHEVVHDTDGHEGTAPSDPDTLKLLQFAEKHRAVLNQVLRQNNCSLSDGGPFGALSMFPKLLDFDVKRKHFRKELAKMDDRSRYRREDVPVRVRRAHIFSDSFRDLFRLRGNDWKSRFYVMFDGEEGQDAGGLLREWFAVITREIFNPNYALFITAPGDRVTYMINKASYINPEHMDYFKFVGRIIAKAVHDNKLLDCYFTRAFYKHILNLPVRYQDMESEDPDYYKSLEFLLNNPVEDIGADINFTLEVEEFGVRSNRPLKPDGQSIAVTDENKEEYVRLVCQMKMTGSIRKQLDAFLEGFYEVIPKHLIAMFNEQELELLISGLPNVDIDDLMNNTEYRGYNKNSAQIQWFWRALRSFEQEDRAKFLQFVTGTSKVPLQGFSTLEGMNGVQKFSIHMDSRGGHRLPAAHTCFNQLDLPQYESYEKLRECLLLAIRECTEGFGFA